MSVLAAGIMSMLQGGQAAGGDPWAGLRTVGGASGGNAGSSFWSALQGGATLFSVVNSYRAEQLRADDFDASALDAESEIDLERLAGVERRASLKREAYDHIGDMTVAFAASGQDLTFGSPAKARERAFRDLDTAVNTATNTEETRIARLKERADTYRSRARRVRSAAPVNALAEGLQFGASLARRG